MTNVEADVPLDQGDGAMLNCDVNAYRANEEPWRIERLDLLLQILNYQWRHWDDAPDLTSLTRLHDHKGLLTVSWSKAPSRQAQKLVKDLWALVFNEHEVEHVIMAKASV